MLYVQYWALWMVGGIVNFLFLMRILEQRYSIKRTLLVYNGVLAACMTVKAICLSNQFNTAVFISTFIIFILHLVFALTFFNGSRMQKLMASTMIYIVSLVAEILTVSLLSTFFYVNIEKMLEPSTFYFMFAFEYILILLFTSIISIFWKRNNNQCSVKSEVCFAIMMLAQFIMLVPFFMTNLEMNGRIPKESLVGIMFGISFGILFTAFLPIMIAETSKREKMEDQLKELKRQYELGELHWRYLETKKRELQKLEHDFRNQLTTVYNLTDSGEVDKAKELLIEIEQRIAS